MNEKEFGYQIRQALNEAAAGLDYKTTYRSSRRGLRHWRAIGSRPLRRPGARRCTGRRSLG